MVVVDAAAVVVVVAGGIGDLVAQREGSSQQLSDGDNESSYDNCNMIPPTRTHTSLLWGWHIALW